MRSFVSRIFDLDQERERNFRVVTAFVLSLLIITGLMPLLLAQCGGFVGGAAFMDWDGNMAPSAGETFSLIRAGNDIFISGRNMQFRYFRNYGALENSVPLSKYEQATVFTRLTNLSNAPNIGPHYTISDCLQRVGNECSKWGFVQLPSYPTLPPVYDAFLTVSSVVGKNDAFTITGPNLPTTALNMIEVTAGKQKYITIPWTLAKALGIRSPLPPIFIPFSGGRISMDLDCDGFVDPGLLISPILAANPFVPIPTLSEWGMIIMLAALMGYGIIRLRRSGHKLTLS